MSLTDRILAFIVPHDCFVCGQEGEVICQSCLSKLPGYNPVCFKCYQPSDKWKLCQYCMPGFPFKSAIIIKHYDGYAKKLVWELKNNGLQEAARIIARCMYETIRSNKIISEQQMSNTILVPAPTSNKRRRQRGYDQSELIAKELSLASGLPYKKLLMRNGDIHQVGSSAELRRLHLKGSFAIKNLKFIQSKTVILIDDVITTGSTLEEAARILINNGAAQIHTICFAHPRLRLSGQQTRKVPSNFQE